MAAGVPVLASRIGALPELVDGDGLLPPGDASALAAAIPGRFGDVAAGERGLARVRDCAGRASVAAALGAAYELAGAEAA
jgi:glycosyltransferase involved in cell wall biosynthesis